MKNEKGKIKMHKLKDFLIGKFILQTFYNKGFIQIEESGEALILSNNDKIKIKIEFIN